MIAGTINSAQKLIFFHKFDGMLGSPVRLLCFFIVFENVESLDHKWTSLIAPLTQIQILQHLDCPLHCIRNK